MIESLNPDDNKVNGLGNDERIMQIICSYLPNYLYFNSPSINYNIMGCSATMDDGLTPAWEWIKNAINDNTKKNKSIFSRK